MGLRAVAVLSLGPALPVHYSGNRHTGINAAAILEVGADDDVIEAHHRGERADGQNQREGSIPGRDKGETDDVCLARSPVAVKEAAARFQSTLRGRCTPGASIKVSAMVRGGVTNAALRRASYFSVTAGTVDRLPARQRPPPDFSSEGLA